MLLFQPALQASSTARKKQRKTRPDQTRPDRKKERKNKNKTKTKARTCLHRSIQQWLRQPPFALDAPTTRGRRGPQTAEHQACKSHVQLGSSGSFRCVVTDYRGACFDRVSELHVFLGGRVGRNKAHRPFNSFPGQKFSLGGQRPRKRRK